MKITIAGSGAMGCRFGAALFEAGHQVLLLDGWAGHVAAINQGGLRVTDDTGTRPVPVPAALLPAVADQADLVIVFAKATATATVAALAAAGLPTRVTDDAMAVIWAKVAFNCVMNSLCAIASIPVSALARYDGFDALASRILAEVEAVAGAEGVRVDPAAALALMRAQFDPSASGDHLASTLQDLMNGRPTEIAHLNGAIASRAVRHGLDAPVNALITQLIGLLEATWPRRVNHLEAG